MMIVFQSLLLSDYLFDYINNNTGTSSCSNSSSSSETTCGGYWEPHTSSIDFCERNYGITKYVAEPQNVLSSLYGISLIGLIGLWYGIPNTGASSTRSASTIEVLRYKLMYVILILIGIGSAALHGTLHWIFQSADELPMIYLTISAVYILLEQKHLDSVVTDNDTSSNSNSDDDDDDNDIDKDAQIKIITSTVAAAISSSIITQRNSNRRRQRRNTIILVMVCVINTIIYYRYQQMYIVFLLTFISMLILCALLHVQIAWNQWKVMTTAATIINNYDHNRSSGRRNSISISNRSINIRKTNAKIALTFYIWHYVLLIGIATPIWVLDQVWCDTLSLLVYNDPIFMLPILIPVRGWTFHVVWHVLAGYSTHLIIQFLVVCQLNSNINPNTSKDMINKRNNLNSGTRSNDGGNATGGSHINSTIGNKSSSSSNSRKNVLQHVSSPSVILPPSCIIQWILGVVPVVKVVPTTELLDISSTTTSSNSSSSSKKNE